MPSTPSIPRSAWFTVIVAAIALGGCSESTPPDADTESPAASYVRTSDWGEGDAALLEGTVALENGCFTVVDDAGQVIVPIFPTDFRWNVESRSLSGFGHTFSEGDSVSLGGGFTGSPPSVAEHVPSSCDGSEFFIVHSV